VKVLVFAAHPDDEVLGVGGTIAKHVDAGDVVTICILCEGREFNTLKDNALSASSILGIKDEYFVKLPDQQLDRLPLVDVIKATEKYVSDIKPDIVYTHHRGDINRDHQIVFEASMVATRTISKHVVSRILCYEVPSSTEQGCHSVGSAFLPNVFVDITPTLERKIQAMRQYKGEMRYYPHPRSGKALIALAEYRGSQSGFRAAEAFMLVRQRIP